ncbi:hypothetical protein [Parafrankia sp. FMc2]
MTQFTDAPILDADTHMILGRISGARRFLGIPVRNPAGDLAPVPA